MERASAEKAWMKALPAAKRLGVSRVFFSVWKFFLANRQDNGINWQNMINLRQTECSHILWLNQEKYSVVCLLV